MRIIDRYIARELVMPFAIGFCTFLVLLIGNLLFDNIDYVLKQGIPLSIVGKLVLYSIPRLLVYTFPVSVLFATSLTINRLARDSEITAMRIATVSIYRLLVPIAIFGAVMSVVAFVNGEVAAPWAEHRAQQAIRQMWQTQALPPIQPNVFFNSENNWFYVDKVKRTGTNTSTLEHVMIYQLSAGEGYPLLITAEKAWSKDNVWYLQNGIRHELDNKGFTKLEQGFKTLTINLKRPFNDYLVEYKSTQEMGMGELRHQLTTMQRSGVRIAPDMLLELHLKIALPLACLVVGLCCAPLGLKFARSGSFMGILLSIMVVFLYHNTMLLCKALGTNGGVPPVLAAWAPNMIFALAGAYLIWKER